MPLYRRKAGVWALASGEPDASPGNRDNLAQGTYIPGMTPDTVGVTNPLAGFQEITAPDSTTGYIYYDARPAGGVLSNKIFWGKVKCRFTGDLEFKDCYFPNRRPEDMYGNNVGANGGCVENYGNNPPHLKFTDCTFNPKMWFDAGKSTSWGHPVQVGIHGGNFTMNRCEMVNCQDSVNYVGPNADPYADAAYCLIENSWLHKAFYLKPWTGPGAPSNFLTHSDGFQFNTGKNITIRYNLIGGQYDATGYNANPAYNSGDDCSNACIMIQQEGSGTLNYALVRNVLIENNWFAGGAATINIALKNNNIGNDWTFRNNLLARRGVGQWAGGGYQFFIANGMTPILINNRMWDWNGPITGTSEPARIDYH